MDFFQTQTSFNYSNAQQGGAPILGAYFTNAMHQTSLNDQFPGEMSMYGPEVFKTEQQKAAEKGKIHVTKPENPVRRKKNPYDEFLARAYAAHPEAFQRQDEQKAPPPPKRRKRAKKVKIPVIE